MAIHSRTADGGLAVNGLEVPIADPEFWPAGHGSYGTASDYARFMAALLGDGELDGNRILQPETVELAFSDHLDGIALPAVSESAMPPLSHDIPSLPFSQGWGLASRWSSSPRSCRSRSGNHRHRAGDRAGYLRGNHGSGLAKPASGETRFAYRREATEIGPSSLAAG
jgi:CubicO group peptidase (beta-lactamase class C family)